METKQQSADPLDYTCPACLAPPTGKCTVPTDNGRRPVKWVHDSRKDLAAGWK